MGDSSTGILAYGYDLGGSEHWDLEGAGEYGQYEFPWYNENINMSWKDQAENVLLVKIINFLERYEVGTGYYNRRDEAIKKLRVEFAQYGTGDYKGYILATTVHQAYDYGADVIEISLNHAAAGILGVALAALNIVPVQKEPKWILASYYG